MRLKSLAIATLLALGASTSAFSQCQGNPPAGRICANGTAAPTLPSWYTQSVVLDRNFGAPSGQGTILNRGASLWSATVTPSLGLNGTAGGSLTLNGSSTGSAVIGVKAAAGSTIFNMPVGNGSMNQVLQTDGSGNTSWATVSGTGTVTSVGLALPASILTVSGSPVTGTGTLTGTLATQTANTVWAGPTTGAAATPTFRALVGADLPNPAASTLGGIQSAAAVSHEWINSISTGGVPALSQPAFTDISGTITAAQCPNPSASTIGCVESLAAVTSKWINTISTAGVPSATQPNFTDLAGAATLAQFPSISNLSVLGNNSGGTSVPSALSASNVLDMINNVQGDVLYRDTAGWLALAPGTNGQVLTSGGAAANPSWATVSGTGTVTSIATNNGVTGGTITTTGTIGLATIASHTLLANITGGSAIPSSNTPSSILDIIGSTTGDILYRSSGSGWQVLAPGSNGQVLTQGASTPAWGSAGTVSTVSTSGIVTGGPITTTGTVGINATITPEGRLTLTSGVTVMNTSVAGATTVYYTPYAGNLVPLYDGTNMVPTSFAEVSQTTSDTTKSPAAVAASSCYDEFAWVDTGPTFRVTRGPAWTNTGSRSAGTALTLVNGIYLNNATITNGPAASRGTYVGTICSNASSTIDFIYGAASSGGTASSLNVWNAYNRVLIGTMVTDTGTTYTYTTLTIRQARASAGNQISFVQGLQQDSLHWDVSSASFTASASSANTEVGVGFDSTTTFAVQPLFLWAATANQFVSITGESGIWSPGIGVHVLSKNERGDGVNANTFDSLDLDYVSAQVSM